MHSKEQTPHARINRWRFYATQEHALKNNWAINYGARMMSMDLPHTPTPDPLAERHYNWSPYVY
ncbi:hypothetical protein D0T50_13665, partial [Bacteroides sp. 214]|nr:hypothetical protein [Bacteroides sp. 214]